MPLTLARPQTSGIDKKDKAPDYDKVFEIKIADLDDFVVKTDKLVVNNFSLSENAEGQRKGLAMLNFAASCKNRTAATQQYTVMVVGLDKKKSISWALKATCSVDGNGVGLLQDDTALPLATLKGTTHAWVRVIMVRE
jgi:hypothetical protein